MDVCDEDDVVDGTINGYAVLYVSNPHLRGATASALEAWVSKGGILFASGGLGLLNEFNSSNNVLSSMMGIDDFAMFGLEVGPNTSEISYIKQDLAFAKLLDRVVTEPTHSQTSNNSSVLDVVGMKALLKLDDKNNSFETLARFGDGSPALFRRNHSCGLVYVCAFQPGLSYFRSAIPARLVKIIKHVRNYIP